LQDLNESDVVGMTIQNQVNLKDKPIGISFRRKDQLSRQLVWNAFEKVSRSNSRFNELDTLVMTIHSVKMPVNLSARNQERGQTAFGNGTSEDKYGRGEGKGKLPCSNINNSDCQSR